MKLSTADCCSLSVQRASNVSTVSQKPPQFVHSRRFVLSISNDSRGFLHLGQFAGMPVSTTSAGTARVPQLPQNSLPRNMSRRHEGHATVFRRDLQNSHCVRSLATAPPQFGQFNASGCISLIESFFDRGFHNVDRRFSAGPYLELACA